MLTKADLASIQDLLNPLFTAQVQLHKDLERVMADLTRLKAVDAALVSAVDAALPVLKAGPVTVPGPSADQADLDVLADHFEASVAALKGATPPAA